MPRKSGNCPVCGMLIEQPENCFGMWDGKKPDGRKVGGPVLKTTCGQCGCALISFSDLLEDMLHWKIEATTMPKIPN
jgi:hypothetical protein